MESKPKNVFDKLDSIEVSQSVTQTQNQQILELLNELVNMQVSKQNVEINHTPQASSKQAIINFVKSSKKEYVWFGPINEFNKSKAILNILCVALIIVGVLSTIFSSMAFKYYSTYSLFENIWLIFVFILFLYSINAKKRMIDTYLKDHSCDIFIQDADNIWRNTNKEKKRFKWFRRISYISVICNIILIWNESQGAIAIISTILELAFAGITIGVFFANINLFCMYGNFILFTGKKASNTETVTLIFDVMGNKLAPYEEYKGKMKELL